MLGILPIILLFFLTATAKPTAQERHFTWDITRLANDLPDGIRSRGAIGINGRPGSETIIDVVEGDLVVVNVTNSLEAPTTIHWHGIPQLHNAEHDGASMITQCPIPPGQSFVYRWRASPAGTYWWHAHHRAHYADGLRGPLIVRQRNEVDEKLQVVFIEDRDYRDSEQIIDEYLKPGALVPLPSSGLINHHGLPNGGFGVDLDSSDHTFNATSISGSNFSHFVLKSHLPSRFHVINAASVMIFTFSIDNHKLRVVGVDGTRVYPSEEVDVVEVDIGQRVVVEVIGNADPSKTYWMRATMPKSAHNMSALTIRGIVTYASYDSETTIQPHLPWSLPPSNPTILNSNGLALRPINVQRAPPPHVTHILAWDFHVDTSGRDNSSVTRGWTSFNLTRPLTTADGETWMPPEDRPLLYAVADGTVSPGRADARRLPIWVQTGQVVDLVMLNREFPPHPFHLHGHTVQVLGSGTATSVAEIPISSFDLANPVRRDTWTVPSGDWPWAPGNLKFGWTVVRFVADNPGAWLLHCHLEYHIEAGLAMSVLYVDGAARESSSAGDALCDAFHSYTQAQAVAQEKDWAPSSSSVPSWTWSSAYLYLIALPRRMGLFIHDAPIWLGSLLMLLLASGGVYSLILVWRCTTRLTTRENRCVDGRILDKVDRYTYI